MVGNLEDIAAYRARCGCQFDFARSIAGKEDLMAAGFHKHDGRAFVTAFSRAGMARMDD